MAIGYHFFKEGTAKISAGDFSSRPFLASAKGPFAPLFKELLDDPDGRQLLCIDEIETESGERGLAIDPELTFAIWGDYIDRANQVFDFGDKELPATLAQRRKLLANTIHDARAEGKTDINVLALEMQRDELAQAILDLREQKSRATAILDEHVDLMREWISVNEVELLAHFQTEDRANGFNRDGPNRKQAAIGVDSLRAQVQTIRSDRQKQKNEWATEVKAIWDSLERKINGLAVVNQTHRPMYRIHRPFDQRWSANKIIDMVIPWFDTIVGAMLMLGLLTRFASLAAATFLFSVILSQPPWIPGTVPTWMHAIEALALLVIFAMGAGRMGGLDYFISLKNSRTASPEMERHS